MDASKEKYDRDAIARELSESVRGDVRFGVHDRMLYATDASLYQVEPIGVVIPQDVEDTMQAIAFCSQKGLPILPRGGGTSLAGQCVNRAVVIDFSPNCRHVGDVDKANRRVSTEPGVTLDELNEEIARQGQRLFFAPDVATSRHANVGGMIGNNAAGAHSILYGRTVEHVVGLDVALVDRPGEAHRVRLDRGAARSDERVGAITTKVIEVVSQHADAIGKRFATTIRRSSGYNLDLILNQIEMPGEPMDNVNLASLVCGSEGTLAVTLGAELNLEPTPTAKGLAIVSFDSLRHAIEKANAIIETSPSAIEMLDNIVITLARKNAQHCAAVDLLPRVTGADPSAALYVEYFAHDSAVELYDRFEELRRVVRGAPMKALTAPADMRRAWSLRKAAEPLLHGLPGLRKPIAFVEDTAVDPARLPEFLERFRAIVESQGAQAAYYAHVSVGCLHIRPMLDVHEPSDRDRLRAISAAVADLVREFGGAMSGEHGDGRVRGPLLERMFGADLMSAFREIKAIFDPANLLNPGNIVEPGPIEAITTKLRVLPENDLVRVPVVETYFDYSDQHDFAGAVEMCNGAGVCRKKQGGVMCPSYQATLDERHSTRGRGNALRLAITGQFGKQGAADWSDAETMRTLDWCLSCKACKTECPSNVDIARLKSEYTAQRYKAGARPTRRDRLFARIRLLNRIGSLAPGLANRLQTFGPVRGIMNRTMGLPTERSLPKFGRSLGRRRAKPKRAQDDADRPVVALFVDCFTGFGESHIGLAAIETLEALGFAVRLVDAVCCQRPAISLGLLEQAVSRGERLMRSLESVVRDGSIEALVFLEPSCLSAVVDDLQSLRLEAPDEGRRLVADKSMLLDSFFARALDEHPHWRKETGPPVLLHGHCHQKALWGVETSAGMLRRLAGDRLQVLETGCCGMAGAFGMSRDRFELSMKIGEGMLLPTVRAAPTDAIIVAPGASCRHQIRDGAGRIAVHPIEVAAGILREKIAKERR